MKKIIFALAMILSLNIGTGLCDVDGENLQIGNADITGEITNMQVDPPSIFYFWITDDKGVLYRVGEFDANDDSEFVNCLFSNEQYDEENDKVKKVRLTGKYFLDEYGYGQFDTSAICKIID